MVTVRPFIISFIIIAAFLTGLTRGTSNAATGSLEIHVGSELEFSPYAFIDERGQPTGFSVDLIKAVADVMGLSIKISTGPWDTIWNDLVAGRLDVLPIVAKLPERTRLVDFSIPHTETYDAFFVRKGDHPIQNVEAARGKEIVVMQSDAAHHALLELNFPGRLILVDTIPEGLALVASGQHDAFLCSKLIGTLEIKKYKLRGLTAGPTIPDYKRTFSFAVKKGDAELLEKLNQGLLIVKTSGEYYRIYEKWLTAEDPWLFKLKKYLLPAIATLIAVALIVGLWVMMLHLLVKKRTRELAETNAMLSQAREELEERVEQRTIELVQSNRALKTEITERKQAEDERVRLIAELARSNRELEQFAYLTSHDLQAPLRSIIGFLALLSRRYKGKLDAEADEFIKFTVEGAERMQHLINDILTLSQVGTRGNPIDWVDSREPLANALDNLQVEMEESRAEVTFDKLPVITADRNQLAQLFQNLIGNAIKYRKAEEPPRIHIVAEVKEVEWEFRVSDNGIGFDPQYAERIFQIFQRLHTVREYTGTGIGLAICKKIVERHGGRIWVESEPGKGSTFFFTLPKVSVSE
jgi:signal transduction histidine kinase